MSSRVEPEIHLLASVLTGNATILADMHVATAKKAGHTVINVRLNSGSEADVQSLAAVPSRLDQAVDRVIATFEALGKKSFHTGIRPGDLSKSRHYKATYHATQEEVMEKKENELAEQKRKLRETELDKEIAQTKIEAELTKNSTTFEMEAFQEFMRRLRETNKATVKEAAKVIYAQDQKTYEDAMRMMDEVTNNESDKA